MRLLIYDINVINSTLLTLVIILLAVYTRFAGSYVVQCLMVTKLFLKSTATLCSAPLPVAK